MGAESSSSVPDYLVIGRVARPHGVRGEFRVRPHTDQPERFGWLRQILVGETPPIPYPIEKARIHQGKVILKLSGCENRDQAEAFRGQLLQIPLDEALPLEAGEYYLFQLIGLQIETAVGDPLGVLSEILQTGANDVFVVSRPGGKADLLLPDIPGVVVGIDLAGGRITVELPPGLRDE